MAIVLDATHYLYRNVFASIKEVKESPAIIAHKTLQGYLKQSRDFGCARNNRMIIALDSRPSWRHIFFEQNMHKFEEYEKGYKGDRVADDSIPWKEIYSIYDELHNMLDDNSDFEVFRYRLAEADDIVAVAAKYFGKKLNEPVFVVSSDKDFRQLQNTPLVNIYDPIKGMFIPDMGPDGAYEYKLLHIIKGDGGDGIRPIRPTKKNAKSMGDSAALKVRKELTTILKTEPHVKERFEFNQELIDFAFIPIKLQCLIEKELETTKFNYNMNGMVQLMKKFRLRKLADRISEFRLPEEKRVTKKNSHFDGRKFEDYSETALNDFFGDDDAK